ncbi:hypothetical protein NDU88_009136, partial [Pleurodeles waltl]
GVDPFSGGVGASSSEIVSYLVMFVRDYGLWSPLLRGRFLPKAGFSPDRFFHAGILFASPECALC